MISRRELTDAFVTASRALVGIAVHSVGAAPVEITVAQFRLLVLVAPEEKRTIGDIAELLGVNQSNASRHCDRGDPIGWRNGMGCEGERRRKDGGTHCRFCQIHKFNICHVFQVCWIAPGRGREREVGG